MSIKKERIYRIFGKILFLLYIVFLIYFLFLAEWYGRTEVTEEYRYNLELFKEIRRFLTSPTGSSSFATSMRPSAIDSTLC